MTRTEVRDFIESGINELQEFVQFNSGRVSEFNSQLNKTYPYCWLESLSTSVELGNRLPYDSWNIRLHIAKLDKVDSTEQQYEDIVDECDYIAQKLQNKYNAVVEGYKLVSMVGIRRDPFIKKHADCLTGVILSFTLNTPDKTNIC